MPLWVSIQNIDFIYMMFLRQMRCLTSLVRRVSRSYTIIYTSGLFKLHGSVGLNMPQRKNRTRLYDIKYLTQFDTMQKWRQTLAQ